MSNLDDAVSAVFDEYRLNLKPLIAEVEALSQRFPTAVLNEIRACFDHLSRCYTTGCGNLSQKQIEEEIKKAKGHIDRAQFDCYKILIVLFFDQTEEFRKRHAKKDWSTVDGGRFNAKFHELRGKAEKLFQEAKKEKDNLANWSKTCQAYRKLDAFLNDPKNVLKVDEGKNKPTWRANFLWCLLGAVLGAVFSSLLPYLAGLFN